MAIALRNAGTWAAANNTQQAVSLPTHQAGDMLLVRVAFKHATMPTTVTCATAGWAKLGEKNSAGGASSNGGGGVQVAVFWKIATSSSETNPVITFNGGAVAATPSAAVASAYSCGANEVFASPVGDGSAFTAATSISDTIDSHISATAGDLIEVLIATNDNTTLTVPSFTQTGLTLAAVVESPAAALSSATSNDISADGCYRIVSSGTSSAAAVVTGTNSVADEGCVWTTRLRLTPDRNVNVSPVAAVTAVPAVTASSPPVADNAYETEVFADNPAYVFSAEEASGNLTDLIGGLVGTANGGPTYGVTGPISGKTAISFDTSDTEYISIPDSATTKMGDGPVTIEVWVKPTSASDNGVIFAKGSNQPFLPLADLAAGSIEFYSRGTGLATHATGNPLTTDWQHLVGTKDSVGDAWKIYRNGSDVSVTDGTPSTADNTTEVNIGRDNGGTPGTYYHGAWAYLAVYKSVLSPTRIQAHYDAANSGRNVDATPVAAVTSVPAVTVAVGVNVAVSPVAAVTAVPAVSVDAGSSYQAGITYATPRRRPPRPESYPVGTIVLTSDTNVDVTPVPAVTAVPSVTAAAGRDTALTPVAAVTAVPAVTAAAGRDTAVTPVPAVTTVPAATAAAGAATSLSPVAAVTAVPAVTVAVGADTAVSPVAAVTTVPAVTVNVAGSVNVNVDPVPAVTSVPAVTVAVGADVAVSPVAAITAVPAVTVSTLGAADAAVTPVPVITVVPPVTVTYGVNIALTPVNIFLIVPVVTVSNGGTAPPTIPPFDARPPARSLWRREPVAQSLYINLVRQYGPVEGPKVYEAMRAEGKGPFAPGAKYDPAKVGH